MSAERVDRIVKILFTAVAVAIPALIVVRHLLGWDPLAVLPEKASSGMAVVGWVFLALGALTCAVNVYLYVIAPGLYRLKGDKEADYRGPSGLPGIGSLFIGCAALFLAPSVALGMVMLVLYFADSLGLPRAVLALGRGG